MKLNKTLLQIRDISVETDGKQIIKDLNLDILAGEIQVLMGPNGSGKSTLSYAISGHPQYHVTGKMLFEGKNVLSLTATQRARLGIMLGFQNPVNIPGVSLNQLLRVAYRDVKGSQIPFTEIFQNIQKWSEFLNLNESFLKRWVNDGFSGGEKKKAEMLQLLVLNPKLAILDEVDTGLDIDALKTIAKAIHKLKESKTAVLLITHNLKLLKYITADKVAVILKGKIIKSGGREILKLIEEKGYAAV